MEEVVDQVEDDDDQEQEEEVLPSLVPSLRIAAR